MKTFSINCRGKLVRLDAPKIMGILNLTPDSFSDGGLFTDEKRAMLQVEKMISEGADIIDVGPQSTRPNAHKISAKEEILRIGNCISKIKASFPEVLVSLDTFYSDVVKFGFDQGIDMVNDISGGQFDTQFLEIVANTQLPYILMHVNPSFEQMHQKLIDEDVISHVNKYFFEKVDLLRQIGIKDILLDPGFGFGKTIAQNHQLIDELRFICFNEYPLLVGVSRKSFIYKPIGKLPTEINEETQNIHKKLLERGAKILRVHDVSEAKKTVDEFLKKH